MAPPYPGAFTEIGGQKLVVARARRLPVSPAAAALAQGLHVRDGRIIGVCGDGGLIDVQLLLSGGRALDATQLGALLAAPHARPHT